MREALDALDHLMKHLRCSESSQGRIKIFPKLRTSTKAWLLDSLEPTENEDLYQCKRINSVEHLALDKHAKPHLL